MASQTRIQSVLDDARWASGTVSGKRSTVRVQLETFPGVVGGEFLVKIVGLTPDDFGQVDVAITCTGFDDDDSHDDSRSASPITYFQEVESLTIGDLSFEVAFWIPFEAIGTEEGATWHLSVYLGKGTSEIFEVPVCRTPESNPEITSVQIAAKDVGRKNHQEDKFRKNSNRDRVPPYTATNLNGEWNLRLPARTPGRSPILAKGLGIFAGIWAAMLASFYWLFEKNLEPVVALGIPLIIMLLAIIFMLFGVSHCTLSREKLVTTHKLFGVPLNWRKTERHDLAGFKTVCLDTMPSPGRSRFNYLVTAKTKGFENVFLALTVFDQNEARVFARKLNQFYSI